MMRQPVVILAVQTFREHLRNRSFTIAILFSALMLYMSFLLGMLAVEQETRVLLDFGLGFIELMALAMAAFGAATGILREMEMKTIYLVLTRPIPRSHYIAGRYLGLMLSTICAVLLMSWVHISILLIKGWSWQSGYFLALLGIIIKVGLATALADFWAMASSSVLTALTITAIVWTLGHFVPEISFLVQRSSHAWATLPMLGIMYLLPNLQLFNFRDRLDVPVSAMPLEVLGTSLGYALLYGSACLFLAYVFFRKKEL